MLGTYVLCPLRWHALSESGWRRRWHLRAYAESELCALAAGALLAVLVLARVRLDLVPSTDVEAAVDHAHDIVASEQRLGLDHEQWLQDLVLPSDTLFTLVRCDCPSCWTRRHQTPRSCWTSRAWAASVRR